jgi:hypothetical protein
VISVSTLMVQHRATLAVLVLAFFLLSISKSSMSKLVWNFKEFATLVPSGRSSTVTGMIKELNQAISCKSRQAANGTDGIL